MTQSFESCVWRAVSSHLSHHLQEDLLAQLSLHVHKSQLKMNDPSIVQYSTPWWIVGFVIYSLSRVTESAELSPPAFSCYLNWSKKAISAYFTSKKKLPLQSRTRLLGPQSHLKGSQLHSSQDHVGAPLVGEAGSDACVSISNSTITTENDSAWPLTRTIDPTLGWLPWNLANHTVFVSPLDETPPGQDSALQSRKAVSAYL